MLLPSMSGVHGSQPAIMNGKLKRIFVLAVAFGVAGFIVLNLLAYMHAGAMMTFAESRAKTPGPESLSFGRKAWVLLTGVTVPKPVSELSLAEAGSDYRSVSIPGENGITLGGWYCSVGDEQPLVILFHGYTSEKSSLLDEAAVFRELGLSVLLVDFRGSGESSESSTTVGYLEAEDVAAAVRFARSDLPHSKLILFGQSMGGAAVLRAMSEFDVEPDAIILESVFDRLLHTVRNRFYIMGAPSFPFAELLLFWGGVRAGFDGFDHNPVEYALSVECPALFIHGTADPKARLEEGRRVYEAASGPKTFVEISDAVHENCLESRPDMWKAAVGEFLSAAS